MSSEEALTEECVKEMKDELVCVHNVCLTQFQE